MAIFTTPFPQFLDENGDPIVNGYVYFGIANTDPEANPKTIYDLDGNILANPQRTNALGQCSVPIDLVDTYSISVRNSDDVQLWECPEFSGIGSGGGGSSTNYWEAVTDAGSGTTVIRINSSSATGVVLDYPQILLGTNTSNIPMLLNSGGSIWSINPALNIPITASGTNTYTATLTGLTLTDGYIVTVVFTTNTLPNCTIAFNGGSAIAIRGRTGATGILPQTGALSGVQRIQYSSANTCWIALDVKEFNLDTTAANFQLNIGEKGYFTFSTAASRLLRLSGAADQHYRFTLTVAHSITGQLVLLKVNNTTSTVGNIVVNTRNPNVLTVSQGSTAGADIVLSAGPVIGATIEIESTGSAIFSNSDQIFIESGAYGSFMTRNDAAIVLSSFTSIAPSSGTFTGNLIVERTR